MLYFAAVEHKEVVVIGGGVMGCSAAMYLAKSGKEVLLLEQFELSNDLNASQDHSKAFRIEYADDIFWSKWALESRDAWLELEAESGQQVFYPCGILMFGKEADSFALRSCEALQPLGIAPEMWAAEETFERYPQFGRYPATFSALGGLLEAGTATLTFAEMAKKHGAVIRENQRVVKVEGNQVSLADGTLITAGQILIAAGMWAKNLLDLPIQTTRQQLIYFRPTDVQAFQKDHFPVFADLDIGWYGFPIHGNGCVKISNHIPAEEILPEAPRHVDDSFITDCRNWLQEHIPGLADAEVMGTKVCLYQMTADENFLIDRLNDYQVVASGFSGHGFKFGPVAGKLAADLILGKEADPRFDRFKL